MKTKQLALRWSLVTGGLIALFWAVWYLIAGDVPVTNSIKMIKEWPIIFPFGVSRWWDILIGPIWSTIIIFLLTSEKLKGGKDLAICLVAGLGTGLAISLPVGLISGLVTGLAVGLVASLLACLISGLVVGLINLIKYGTSVDFWVKAWNWLLVRP